VATSNPAGNFVDVSSQFATAIPGGFSYFGTNQTSAFMGSGGYLTFGVGSGVVAGSPLPTGAPPRIAASWDNQTFVAGTTQLRVNSATPGVFNLIWNNTMGLGGSSNLNIYEMTLLGAGNPFGAAPGTIVLSYQALNSLATPDKQTTIGLNAGDGTNFAVLPSTVSPSGNGVLTETQAAQLPVEGSPSAPGIWSFTPSGAGYSVIGGPPPVPEPASLTLLSLGVLGMIGYSIRRRKQAA
jgi:hypothetical protein